MAEYIPLMSDLELATLHNWRIQLRPHAQHLANVAKQHAPYDASKPPGADHLRDQIHVEDEYEDALSVVSEADYSVHQEFGTYKMAAHPFMRPALAELQGIVGRLETPGATARYGAE